MEVSKQRASLHGSSIVTESLLNKQPALARDVDKWGCVAKRQTLSMGNGYGNGTTEHTLNYCTGYATAERTRPAVNRIALSNVACTSLKLLSVI